MIFVAFFSPILIPQTQYFFQDGGGQRKRPSTALPASHPAMKKAKLAVKVGRKNKNEIRRPEQILKQRVADEKKAARKAKGGGKKKRR